MNNNKQELRNKLIRYINSLLTKQHIEMKSTLQTYKTKLDMEDNLTPTEFNVLLKFLVRESNRTKEQIKEYFGPVVGKKTINTDNKEIADLSSFLTEETTEEIRH